MQLHPMWDAYPNLQTDLKDVLTTIEKKYPNPR